MLVGMEELGVASGGPYRRGWLWWMRWAWLVGWKYAWLVVVGMVSREMSVSVDSGYTGNCLKCG